MPTQESELTCEAKQAIRAYLLKIITLPAIVASILSFCLGMAIREGAAGQAVTDAMKSVLPSITAASTAANDSAVSAERAKVNATKTLAEAEQVAKSLKRLDELQKSLQATDNLITGVANALAANPDFKQQLIAASNASVIRTGTKITLRSGTDSSRLLFNHSEQGGLEMGGTKVNAQKIDSTNPAGQWTIDKATK